VDGGAPDAAGYTVSYIIHRMCTQANTAYNGSNAGVQNECAQYFEGGASVGGSNRNAATTFRATAGLLPHHRTRARSSRHTKHRAVVRHHHELSAGPFLLPHQEPIMNSTATARLKQRFHVARQCGFALALALACGSALAAQTDISNTPLSSIGSAVLPNVMFVLDDSGSMSWDHLPDYVDDNNTCRNDSFNINYRWRRPAPTTRRSSTGFTTIRR
jgi:hypothetical protein